MEYIHSQQVDAGYAHALRVVHGGDDAATQFWDELLESFDCLAAIADEYGSRTLADSVYLLQAIRRASFIDHVRGESHVLEVASRLPSGDVWCKFIEVNYMTQQTPNCG